MAAENEKKKHFEPPFWIFWTSDAILNLTKHFSSMKSARSEPKTKKKFKTHWVKKTSFSAIFKFQFYLPQMKYEESIGFVSGKFTFFIAEFQVLELYTPKKHDLSEKNISSVTHRCKTNFLPRLQPSPQKLES
jgi:hypothetical protein